MTSPGQREVPVKKAESCGLLLRRTLAFFLVIALPAFAQDAGVADAPLAVRHQNGNLELNPLAEKALDDELKRLQGVERSHKAESWTTVVLVSSGVGLVVGAAIAAVVTGLALKPAPAAAPPSP